IGAGEIPLVIILGLNSAIAAWYYLRLAGAPLLGEPGPDAEAVRETPFPARRIAAVIGAAATVVLAILANPLMRASGEATRWGAAPAPGTVVEGEVDADGAAEDAEAELSSVRP